MTACVAGERNDGGVDRSRTGGCDSAGPSTCPRSPPTACSSSRSGPYLALDPGTMTLDRATTLIAQRLPLVFVAIGQTIVVMNRGFDLSVAGIVALTNVVVATTMGTGAGGVAWGVTTGLASAWAPASSTACSSATCGCRRSSSRWRRGRSSPAWRCTSSPSRVVSSPPGSPTSPSSASGPFPSRSSPWSPCPACCGGRSRARDSAAASSPSAATSGPPTRAGSTSPAPRWSRSCCAGCSPRSAACS